MLGDLGIISAGSLTAAMPDGSSMKVPFIASTAMSGNYTATFSSNGSYTLSGGAANVTVSNALNAHVPYVKVFSDTFKPDLSVSKANVNISNALNAYVPYVKVFFDTFKPDLSVSKAAVSYQGLTDKAVPYLEADSFPGTILEPHYTNALYWNTGYPVLNRGAPTSTHDPVEYLRSAVIDSDWDTVAAWYAYFIQNKLTKFGNSNSHFWDLAQLNINDFRYVVLDDGSRGYFPMSNWDVKQFITKVAAKLSINDVGKNRVGFGFIDYTSGKYVGDNLSFQNFVQYVRLNAIMEGDPVVNNAFKGVNAWGQQWTGWSSNFGQIKLGWRQGPEGAWQLGDVLMVAIIAVVSYGIGSVIGGALLSSGGIGASSGISTATTASSTATATTASSTATVAATSTAATVASSAVLDEVIISGVAPIALSTAGGAVGAALATGAVVATSAPAISASTQTPTISQATTATPAAQPTVAAPIDEVVVSAAPAASTSVSTGLTTGAVVAAAAPALLTSSAPIDEVTIQATQTTPTNTTAGAATGATGAATTATQTDTQTNSNQNSNASKSPFTTLLDALKKLLTPKPKTGTTTTATTATDAGANDLTSALPWLLLLGGALLVAASTGGKKRAAHRKVKKRSGVRRVP
jgi:hypothetical protein